jgi:hypothetical protein
MVNMSELPRLVIACYYVFTGEHFVKARLQATSLGIDVRDYWHELKTGEEAISTGLKLLQNAMKPDTHFPLGNFLHESS